MWPVILMRGSLAEEKELEIASKYFEVYQQRSSIKNGDLVVARYSALPFYSELEKDIKYFGAEMINSYAQHSYVADLRNWYYHISDLTPKTWFALDQIPEKGPFVLKGQTNSKKFNWNTHMFAEDKKQAIEVYGRLAQDGYVGHQQIYIRQYVPLRKLEQGLNGLPISEEYRFFVLNKKVMSGGFYWSGFTEEIKEPVSPDLVPKEFLQTIIDRVGNFINFFVIDIARTKDGHWIVVELNDGQQSGPSDNDLDKLYFNLASELGLIWIQEEVDKIKKGAERYNILFKKED